MIIRGFFIYSIICFVFQFVAIADSFPQQEGDTLELYTERLSLTEGLSQGLVNCIAQDNNGIMWFGTKDGLNKYDGYHFTVYKHDPENPFSLPSNHIKSIVEDEKGNLWIGTLDKGLCLFDRANEKFYSVRLSKEDGDPGIFGMAYSHGRLTIQNERLASYDVSHVDVTNYHKLDLSEQAIVFNRTKYQAPYRYEHYSIGFDVQIMDNGNIWYSFQDSVVEYGIIANKFERIKAFSIPSLGKNGREGNLFYPLPQPKHLLCVSERSLIVYDTAANEVVKRIPLLYKGRNEMFFAIKNHNKNYYVCKNFGELNYEFNTNTYDLKPVKMANANTLLLDRNGILWVGTPGLGVVKYDYRKQHFIKMENYLAGTPINMKGEFVRMIKNHPYFVNLYSKKTKPVLPPNIWNFKFEDSEYLSDRQGIHWFLYKIENSLFLISYNAKGSVVKKMDIQFKSNANRLFVFSDIRDHIWIAVEDENNHPTLIRVNKQTLQKEAVYKFPVRSDLIDGIRFVSAFWQNAEGVFWFATKKGLFSFDEEQNKWSHFQHNPSNTNSLSTNKLFTVFPDPIHPNKYLWLGTDGAGISLFEIATGKCIHITEKDGLPNNVVYGILKDRSNNLWLSTNNGLCVIDPRSVTYAPTSPITIKGYFTTDDGLPGNEFNRYEYYTLSNGDLFFGGTEGGVIFNPEKLLTKEEPSTLILTNLFVYNKPISHKTDSTVIQQNITYAKSITLPHYKNMFSISFATLDYGAVAKKQYKYFLENYDDDWIESGSKNEATYTNLPPGTYTFHVKGKSSMSDWGEKSASIKIIILPEWYQTWWFKLALLIVVGGTLFVLYQYRLKQQLKLYKVRDRIASDLHDEIGSTLSSISLSSTIIQNKIKGKSNEVDSLLSQISVNSDNMMEAMSDIVWNINTSNDRFDNVINRMRAFAIEILEPSGCVIHFKTSENLKAISLDMVKRKNLYMLFKEAINNVAKYAECQNVWIDIVLEKNKKLKLVIKDDGKGFSSTPTTDEKRDNQFGGNGFTNMQKRSKDLNGELKIISSIGKGTEIFLHFKY